MEVKQKHPNTRQAVRRVILETIVDEGGLTTRSHLAEAIANENLSQYKAEIRLHHIHIPVLMDAGVIDYDDRTGDVVLVEDVSSIDLAQL
ncbi:DUF7344 domain-containing protein [Haloprofundus salilacus]|uniref:DUF7344 domain-containing protein n=1 Tax=Haloprofundus salilacus TaxID=2876190 RepID=UPI001CCFC25C|nr:hypothetical protein [Haloprofundus salilacus]